MASAGVVQLESIEVDTNRVALGQALFFDPVISGGRNISCATCHHPGLVGGDTLPLPIGPGASGIGRSRLNTTSPVVVHRNAIELHNRLDPSFTSFFWDGRVEKLEDGSFRSPAGTDLPDGLESVAAAQSLFPMLSRTEMLGNGDDGSDDNEIADFADENEPAMWNAIMARLLAIDEYHSLFAAAYPGVSEYTIAHAANAIAQFEGHFWDTLEAGEWTISNFNSYLEGENDAMNENQKAGAILFFGEAKCSLCHNGPLLTDQKFYNIGVPPIGPGFQNLEGIDLGRYNVTGDSADRYAFRTPPLREVDYTGPYMHNGVFGTLEEVIRHHLDPQSSFDDFNTSTYDSYLQPYLGTVQSQRALILNGVTPVLDEIPDLSDEQIDLLVEFLKSLSSPTTLQLAGKVPSSVPSGLPVTGP